MPVDVRLEVVEGARATVTEVRFEGVTAISAAQLLESLALTTGKPYYRPQQAIDREAVERRYRNSRLPASRRRGAHRGHAARAASC